MKIYIINNEVINISQNIINHNSIVIYTLENNYII
jgi:hypothetical protein